MISTASHNLVTKRASERGQISIFFASSLIVLISIIAFVINIGLFVKAKINLQNAVDAGAYAGAAVQARMLNRIGYMNWEMRNVYKEWMFKYYVLGNLNIKDVDDPSGASDNIQFTMESDPNLPAGMGGDDIYNFPSVCIHYAGVPTNVCKKYAIPGIPRFEPTSLVGVDETTSTFIDAIVKEKSSDCSKRTQLNFNVTNMWAYNLITGNADTNATFADAPQIASNRPGAWPRAVELAMRTRSLEYAMNRPPISEGICSDPGEGSPGCRSVQEIGDEKHYGNERPTKAFWSAYRNIGNEYDTDLKATFTLTELSPFGDTTFPQNSLSTLLMGAKATERKFYLDLKLQIVNYATFFTGLIARDDRYDSGGQIIKSEGACDVSKIAIPVPGYPLGFYKNPDFVTYYAVKGEGRFQGLFNPFSQPIKLTAYAAAKPMGGRVGPALFRQNADTRVASRTTASKKRSLAYISGLDLLNMPVKGKPGVSAGPGEYHPGMPIPINGAGTGPEDRFWIADPNDDVGGWVTGRAIVFGIPNMVYDYVNGSPDASNYQVGNQNTAVIKPVGNPSDYASGLYKKSQFSKFRAYLTSTNDPNSIVDAIVKARSPTTYEAANYTIPFPSELTAPDQLDTFGFINGAPLADGTRITPIYAPLYGDSGDILFRNKDEVKSAILEFIQAQKGAMEKYQFSMNSVAKKIYDDDPVKYADAAKRISNFDFSKQPSDASAIPQSCASIAGTFLYFYLENSSGVAPNGCPKSLIKNIEEYLAAPADLFDPLMYAIEYYYQDGQMQGLTNYQQLLTGFMPGILQGATASGQFASPFPNAIAPEIMRRTGYSTKLVTLRSLANGGGYSPGGTAPFAIYSEGLNTPLAEDVRQTNLSNYLNADIPPTVTH